MKTHSDDELLDRLRSGDNVVVKEIYRRYFGLLYSHVYRRLPDREEARDIVQEVMLTLWNKREQLVANTVLSSYLYTLTRNRVLNTYRNQKVRLAYLTSLQSFVDKGENITDEKLREKELIELVEKEVSALPPQMKLIFEMSRNLEMSHQQIADELNISPHTVRTQVRSALRILRAKLGANIFLIFF
jgi:RNA polymerase sigma-70 factor (family 1)